jgi:hypothetical protein
MSMVFAMLLAPAAAFATDRFVDDGTGANAGDCSTSVAPCQTINYAISQSASGDTIKVDNGTYNEAVPLGNGRSLIYEDFVSGDGSARPLIDGGATEGITAGGIGGGTISGVRVHSETTAVFLSSPTIVDDVVFDEPLDSNAIGVQVDIAGSGSEIRDSHFVDPMPDPTTRLRGGIYALGQVWVHDNTFADFTTAININDYGPGETVVEDNDVTGAYTSIVQGKAILAQDVFPATGSILVRENRLSAAGVNAHGIQAAGPVRLVRNEVTGHNIAVFVGNDQSGTVIDGDRYWGNTFDALWIVDSPSGEVSSVTATNVTIAGNAGADVRIDGGGQLTLNSSIVETMAPSAIASCTVEFSIGPPNPGSDTTGCFDFQSNADPELVDPVAGNLHLSPSSPAIDTGDPADPGPGAVDFDGDARELEGADECPPDPRRDIGADEFVPAAPLDCTAPDTSITSGLPEGAVTNDPTQTFGLGSTEPGSTFECALDAAGFGACSGANQHLVDLSSAADGEHTLAVRATDAGGNTDATPATRSFTLDRKAPGTTLTKKPPKKLKKKKAVFEFSADEAAEFTCRLDSKPEFTCAGTVKLKVKKGKHTFTVFATDEAGNADASPAKSKFKRVKKKKKKG